MYEDDTTEFTCPKAPLEYLEPRPDATPDHFLNASVVLPQGEKCFQGELTSFRIDPEENPIGRANAQLFLDNIHYEVEFGDGEITKLSANVITESMY